MKKQSALTVLISTLMCACSYPGTPPCTFSGEPAVAPSAGCFSVIDLRLLVVQGLGGDISPPGGSSNSNEAAQCTAVRETWEETGLILKPGRRLATLATGFHLYECQRDADSGEIDPPPRLEVRQAFYLHVDEFDQWEWRYPGEEDLLRKLIKSPGNTPQPDAPDEPDGERVRGSEEARSSVSKTPYPSSTSRNPARYYPPPDSS